MAPKDNRYLTGPVTATLLGKSLPIMGGYFCALTFNLVDTHFVSRLGKLPLAVMGYAEPISMLMFSFAVGLGAGTNSEISRAMGRNDLTAQRRICRDSLLLAALTGLVFMSLGLTLLGPVVRGLGAVKEAMPHARAYMVPWLLSAPLMIFLMVAHSTIQSAGSTGVSGAVFSVGAILNAVLDPILIFGLGPIEAMGISGAAWATFVSRAAMVAFTVLWLAGPMGLLRRGRLVWPKILRSWADLLYVGIPAVATSLLFPVSIGVVTRLAAGFSQTAVAALGAGQRVDNIVMVVYWAMSRVEAPMAGQSYGAGRMQRVHQAQRSGTLLGLTWGVICAAALWSLAGPIAHLLVTEEEVWEPLVLYLRLSAAGLGLRGITVLAGAFFSALKHPLQAASIDVTRMVVLTLPLALLGAHWFGVGGVFGGVALANALAGILAACATERFTRRLLRRHKQQSSQG
jgi:putative MATE family efflux protein